MIISDIMTRNVITVKKNTPLKEAAGLLAKIRIHGMPVIDDSNKIIGIITESDFFTKDAANIYLPTFLDFIKDSPNKKKPSYEDDLENKTMVEDIMTYGCVTVKPNMDLEHLILLFKEHNFNSFPVTDDKASLVGIVTIMDVIRLL